nr:F-actin capping [Cryptococcus depauperatus CBS 7855]
MSEISLEEKCRLASTLIGQTPPGEINDVINDIRAIIDNDDALMPHVLPALRAYNLSQLHVVEHPENNNIPLHTARLAFAAILPGVETERYVDTVGKQSFAFDHLTFVVSDYQPYKLPEKEEAFRSDLAKSLEAYAKNHFPSGYSSVTCSQIPLRPKSSTPAAPKPAAEAGVAGEALKEPREESTAAEGISNAERKPAAANVPVTDVIPEQVNSGDLEPAPTPAEDTAEKEGIQEPGDLERVDAAVKKVNENQEQEDVVQKIDDDSEPKIEEEIAYMKPQDTSEDTEVDLEDKFTGLSVEEEQQERIENPIYTLEIVGNRYNIDNFWTGRWRTRWIVDQAACKVNGVINVDVHYYEQGNVQLATNHTVSFPYPSSASGSQSVVSQIVTTISKIETNYHFELNDVYGKLGDKTFRALRRALPVTRQKMDWDKVTGYSLGADLSKARS